MPPTAVTTTLEEPNQTLNSRNRTRTSIEPVNDSFGAKHRGMSPQTRCYSDRSRMKTRLSHTPAYCHLYRNCQLPQNPQPHREFPNPTGSCNVAEWMIVSISNSASNTRGLGPTAALEPEEPYNPRMQSKEIHPHISGHAASKATDSVSRFNGTAAMNFNCSYAERRCQL